MTKSSPSIKNITERRNQKSKRKKKKSKGKMVLLEKLWDDVVAGPQPERGLGRLRKITTQPLTIKDEGEGSKYQRSMSMPASPGTPATPVTPTTPMSARKENVWRSVFHPGSNLATKSIGAEVFDKPQPNSPTVYDCNQKEAQSQRRKENLALCLVAAWK